jgi:hypothetical protein
MDSYRIHGIRIIPELGDRVELEINLRCLGDFSAWSAGRISIPSCECSIDVEIGGAWTDCAEDGSQNGVSVKSSELDEGRVAQIRSLIESGDSVALIVSQMDRVPPAPSDDELHDAKESLIKQLLGEGSDAVS